MFDVCEIAAVTVNKSLFVIISLVNLGLCYTDLIRSATGTTYYVMKIMRALLAWAAEEGSRMLVHAVTTGKESHGGFISMCRIKKSVSPPPPFLFFENMYEPRRKTRFD